jgi:flagellar M-ring protein FliF
MSQANDLLQGKVKPWWNGLDSGARLQMAAMTIAFIVALVVTFTFILKPTYETLYVGLDPAEAGQVVEKLKEDKIPYKLDSGGTTISIPRKDIYDVRLKMASEGIPRSGTVGYEIFDKTNLGMTDFLQKVNYRRALEGELSKSICSIAEIKTARVHLVIPEPRLFMEDKKEATASVIVHLNGARSLSERQVEGIAYLVSSSVEGLRPENVTIIDPSGKLLSNKTYGDGVGALTSSQMEIQRNVEAYLENKARSMLDPVIGPGKSVVSISAMLNFEQLEKTMENYDPDNLAIRSEERNTESSSEQNTKVDGKGKTVTNSNENNVTNYEVNKTVQHVISQMGNITKLSVAVVVDGNYKPVSGGAKDKEAAPQYVPRTQDELDKITSIVKGAVGYDAERNDVFEIANVAFENRPEIEEEPSFITTVFTTHRVEDWFDLGLKIALGLIALMIFMKMKKKFSEYMERQRIESQRQMAEKEIIRKREEIIPKVSTEPQLVDHLRAIANEKPTEIAKVIKTMMVEA